MSDSVDDVFLKALGVIGENIDHSNEIPIYEIIVGEKVVCLPSFFFGFWKCLHDNGGEYESISKKSFIEYIVEHDSNGITDVDAEEIFDETLKILKSEGVIVALKK